MKILPFTTETGSLVDITSNTFHWLTLSCNVNIKPQFILAYLKVREGKAFKLLIKKEIKNHFYYAVQLRSWTSMILVAPFQLRIFYDSKLAGAHRTHSLKEGCPKFSFAYSTFRFYCVSTSIDIFLLPEV